MHLLRNYSGRNTSVCSFDALVNFLKHGIISILVKVESEKTHGESINTIICTLTNGEQPKIKLLYQYLYSFMLRAFVLTLTSVSE